MGLELRKLGIDKVTNFKMCWQSVKTCESCFNNLIRSLYRFFVLSFVVSWQNPHVPVLM